MSIFRIGHFQSGWMLAVVLAGSLWPAASRAYTPEQQQACTGDAFRLCSAEIPDVDRVTTCMIRNKSQLSPGCRAFFRPDPAPADISSVGRPTNIRPTGLKPARAAKPASPKPASAKPAKPKKPAKPAVT